MISWESEHVAMYSAIFKIEIDLTETCFFVILRVLDFIYVWATAGFFVILRVLDAGLRLDNCWL
jgi:hypothetical protein